MEYGKGAINRRNAGFGGGTRDPWGRRDFARAARLTPSSAGENGVRSKTPFVACRIRRSRGGFEAISRRAARRGSGGFPSSGNRCSGMRYAVRVLAIPMWLCLIGTCAAETMTIREYSARWAHFYADVYRVPWELVEAVIQAESSWDPLAVSRKGAAGLMQLMPETAARFGVKDVFAIPENIRGGVAYLAFLINLFRGDLRLVAAEYQDGESSILSRGLEYSSREVYRYVTLVLRLYNAKRARHLIAQLEPAAERRSHALK